MSVEIKLLPEGLRNTVIQTRNGMSAYWKDMAAGLRSYKRRLFGPSTYHSNTIKLTCVSVNETHDSDIPSRSNASGAADMNIVTTTRLHATTRKSLSETTYRTLELHVIFYNNPLENMRLVIEMLKTHRPSLGQVQYLNMFVYPAVEKPYDDDEDMASDLVELQSLATQLMELIPNVRYVKCIDSAIQVASMAFQHHLILLLAPQLHKLHCNTVYMSHQRCLLTQLETLKLYQYSMYQDQIQQIRTDRLRQLALANLYPNFNWKVFEDKNKPGYIDFCCVKRMHLDTDSYIELAEDSKRFIHIGPTGSFSYTINAPNLKYLRIKLNPLIFSILANTRLPRNLKMLAIKDKNGLIFNLHNVCTKRLVDDVFSKAAEFGDNCLSYTDIIRSLFGNNNMAKQIECVVDRQVRLVDFKDMDKLYFTSLTVRLSISFAVLMALISRMPELVDVVADKVTFPVDAEGVVSLSELESETRPYFGSLPTTIKRMHLTTDDGQHADERTREYLFGFVRKNTKALRDMKLV